jgi:hypothetical protein
MPISCSQANLQERCKLCSCCPQARDLTNGIVVGDVSSLKQIPNVSWSTYLLNEMHMQIKFFREESGFLELQRNGFNRMLHYNGKIHPFSCTLTSHSKLAKQRATIAFVGTALPASAR